MRTSNPAKMIHLLNVRSRLHKGLEVGDRIISAIMLPLFDASRGGVMMGSAQRVVVAQAWTLCDATVQHCLRNLTQGQCSIDCTVAEPGVACKLFEFHRKVGIVVDASPEVYEIMRSSLCTWPAASTENVATSATSLTRRYSVSLLTSKTVNQMPCTRSRSRKSPFLAAFERINDLSIPHVSVFKC